MAVRERIGLLRRTPAGASRAGALLAVALAALAGALFPRLPEDWHLRVLAPGWMPYQIVQLIEYSNDVQVAMLAERAQAPHSRIAVVLITDDTLAGLPYISPLDRGMLARLVRAIDDLGARVIGLDVIFDQATEPEKDQQLEAALMFARASIVLGGADERAALSERRRAFQQSFLSRVAGSHGYFNLRYDVRETARTHVVRSRAGPAKPSFFSQSFAEALARAAGRSTMPESRRIAWRRPSVTGADTFTTLEAGAVLEAAKVPDGVLARALSAQLRDRIVLVGADLERRDRHPTPLSIVTGEDMLGVAIHAQILAGLLDGRTLADLPAGTLAPLAMLAALTGTLTGWFAARRRWMLTLLIGAGTLTIVGVGAAVLWLWQAIVPLAGLSATLIGTALVGRIARGRVTG